MVLKDIWVMMMNIYIQKTVTIPYEYQVVNSQKKMQLKNYLIVMKQNLI